MACSGEQLEHEQLAASLPLQFLEPIHFRKVAVVDS